jgi:hypothetical protein
MNKNIFLTLIIILSLPIVLFPYDLLNVPISATQMAVGGEGGALFGTSNSIAANNAALAGFSGKRFSVSFLKYVQSINIGSFEYFQGLQGIGTVGASFSYCNYGRLTATDEHGNVMYYFTPQALLLNILYARSIIKFLDIGVNSKIGYTCIDTMANMFIAGGININYRIEDLRLGLTVDNIGVEILKGYGIDGVDIKYRFSSSYALAENSYIFLLDLYYDKFNEFDVSCGLQWNVNGTLIIRGGYKNSYRELQYDSSSDIIAGINVGLGINTKKFQIDYTYTPMIVIGDAHRFTIGINL